VYSPKIQEELIQRLYVYSQRVRLPMTTIVNRWIKERLNKEEKEYQRQLERLGK